MKIKETEIQFINERGSRQIFTFEARNPAEEKTLEMESWKEEARVWEKHYNLKIPRQSTTNLQSRVSLSAVGL